jgi:hypothetical protein
MLGFKVSQATVSRYLATENRCPGQSWRTFIRNQAIAFSHQEHPDQQSEDECRGNQTFRLEPHEFSLPSVGQTTRNQP